MIDDALRARALASVRRLTGKPITIGAGATERAREVIRSRANPPSESAAQLAAALCRRFEGVSLRPYICPAGVWTIGYGATFYPTGARVAPSDSPITLTQAESLLQFMLTSRFLPDVIRLCPGIKTPEQLAAITDFTFNLGVGRLKASTLRKRINEGDWDAVPDELRKWTRGGGRVLRGLVARREAEILLIESAK